MTKRLLRATVAAAVLASIAGGASAQDVTITVWAGGSGPNDNYRVDAIEMAADILEREAEIRGEDLQITVQKELNNTWDDFKQAVTLAAEAGNAPHILVTGHEDIAPWAQSGLIVPVEDYLNLDAWPINDIYDNLMEISSFGGIVYGLPQDAESRPFFFWKEHMRAIGYSDEDLDALPGRVEAGEYTLDNVLEDAARMIEEGVVEEGYGFYPRPENGPDYWQFYTSFGGVMEEDGRLVLDKAAMQRFYQFFVDAVEAGVTRKNHIGTPNDQWYSEVASGKAAIWHGGTWHYARYTNQEGLEDFFGSIAFSLIPAGEGGKPNTLTHPLVYVLTDQENDDEEAIAAELIKIASEPRINTLHAIKSAHLGIARQQSNIDLYAGDRWAREATERLLPFANAMPNNTDFGTYWNAMWNGLEASWTGQKTPEQAVSDLETELSNSLGEAIIIR